MKEQIIETAGNIWKILRDNDEVNIARLPKMLKEKAEVVYQSLGWLAREDKISYQTKGGQYFVSLTDAERAFGLCENELSKAESN